MMIKCPYFTYGDVAKKAEAFLKEHHISGEIPIPIEEIIELKLGLNIFPFPRLWKDHKISGFLTGDLATIYVDEVQYEELIEKYRYTLAHELGHYILHKDCYEKIAFSDVENYKCFRISIPSKEIGWFEVQSNWFAGQLLVPPKPLMDICQKVIDKYTNTFRKLSLPNGEIWSYIANEVAPHFNVSDAVVEIQIKREKIPDKITLYNGQ